MSKATDQEEDNEWRISVDWRKGVNYRTRIQTIYKQQREKRKSIVAKVKNTRHLKKRNKEEWSWLLALARSCSEWFSHACSEHLSKISLRRARWLSIGTRRPWPNLQSMTNHGKTQIMKYPSWNVLCRLHKASDMVFHDKLLIMQTNSRTTA